MFGKSIWYISYWINLLIFVVTGAWNGVMDIFGLNKPPTAAPVAFDASTGGVWQNRLYPTPIIGVGVANFPDGRLLIWSAYARDRFSQPDVMDKGRTRTAILDPFAHTSSEELVRETEHDMFCPGTVYLPDRSIMITGGSTTERTTLYHVDTNTWTKGPDMNVPRGYHSMTLLGDGSVFTFGGSWSGGIGGKDGEMWAPDTNDWRVLSGVKGAGSVVTDDMTGAEKGDNHMWLFTAPNSDRLFHPGPSRMTHWIDVSGNGQVTQSVKREDKDKMCGNAVMYDVGKILVIGGSPDQDAGDAYREAFVFDINNGETVELERVGDMIHPRVFASAVALPSGQVVVAGGQTRARKFSDAGGVLQAELYDPDTKQFTPLAPMINPRVYHSACILLKDATIACMGGGLCVDWTPLPCNNHFDYEIYTPPYLLTPDLTPAVRPFISTATSSVELGGLIDVTTDVPDCTFAIVRLGVVTHTISNDLRRIPLHDVESMADSTTYSLRLTSNANIVLPGMYWLFALNDLGVPSEGWNIEISQP